MKNINVTRVKAFRMFDQYDDDGQRNYMCPHANLTNKRNNKTVEVSNRRVTTTRLSSAACESNRLGGGIRPSCLQIVMCKMNQVLGVYIFTL